MNKIPLLAIFSITFSVFLTSCGSKSEKICLSSIKDNLINPETAEFFEFSDISMEKFGQLTGDRNSSSYEGSAADVVRSETSRILKEKMADFPNATFHSVRVKADGKIGNKITQNMLCVSLPEGCQCVEGS